ncbi:MAG TPA: hypothetical protein VMR98_05240, partial [Candidatus Polarisedimenticolaceae bacterium]|nr:hypothetical protein [Candidatus Polarisedimenticolaceae bacterium]
TFIIGLHSLIGQPGIGIGALTTLCIGNPISSVTQPKQFLLEPWGDIGQWFTPGAGGTLFRNVVYFPDASTTFPIWVLLGWTALGVLLVIAGSFRGTKDVKPEPAKSRRIAV